MLELAKRLQLQDSKHVPLSPPERFAAWLARQEEQGRTFTEDQRRWLEIIRDHVVANLSIERDDFAYVPFAQEGGIGKVYQLFGEELWGMLEELNEVLAA